MTQQIECTRDLSICYTDQATQVDLRKKRIQRIFFFNFTQKETCVVLLQEKGTAWRVPVQFGENPHGRSRGSLCAEEGAQAAGPRDNLLPKECECRNKVVGSADRSHRGRSVRCAHEKGARLRCQD